MLYTVALEYIPGVDVTLLYCFNMDLIDFKKLFCVGDWFWENAIIPAWATKPLKNVINQDYYYIANNRNSTNESNSGGSLTKQILAQLNIKGDDNSISPEYYYLSCYQTDGIKIFENLNGLLHFRDIVKTWKLGEKYREWKLKEFCIRIDTGIISGIEEFDSIDELKDLLKTKYNAKRLVPLKYTPWDDKDFDEKNSREVDNLTLLYLYEYHTFATR